jgi:hypothetical protein
MTLRMPSGGLWVRPAAGLPVPVALRRFADTFAVTLTPVLGGRASEIPLDSGGTAAQGWEARLTPLQPTTVCSAAD